MSGSLKKPSNKPDAYIKGYCNFYGRDFDVTPDVLIPRPETEAIIDATFNLFGRSYLPGLLVSLPKIPPYAKILDIGTGSGCIAVTLKAEFPYSHVTACDISDAALKIAKQNAKKFDVDINFVHSDLISNTGTDFDVIIANLPYVDKEWDWLDFDRLSYEPEIALYAARHGFSLIYELLSKLADKSYSGFLILEADPCQHDGIIHYAEYLDFNLLEVRGFALVLQHENLETLYKRLSGQ